MIDWLIGPWLLRSINSKSVADRSVSVLMTLSDIERRDARGHIFQADLLNNARTVWSITTKFGSHMCGGAHFQGVNHTPPPPPHWGGAPALQFWGSYLRTVYPLTPNYQIWRGDIRGEGLFLGQPYPYPNGRVPSGQRSPIWGFLIFMCTPFVVELPNLMW